MLEARNTRCSTSPGLPWRASRVPCRALRYLHPLPTAAGVTMPIDAPEGELRISIESRSPRTGSFHSVIKCRQASSSIRTNQHAHRLMQLSRGGLLAGLESQVKEQDGRLNPFLRANAASHDARLLLGRAVWLRLKIRPARQSEKTGLRQRQCPTAQPALAQLAVTGREAFNSFVGWNPTFGPASSGPQVQDLMQLVRQGRGERRPSRPP